MEEARDLAIVLRAGALPAPVQILEERTVGPSLGQDSIDQGILATMIGSLLVVLFMAIYYKLSGLVADTALVINVILILGTLAAFKATLTLPGIAGTLLTVGMAVDANVLIFERVREELRLVNSPGRHRCRLRESFYHYYRYPCDDHCCALFLFSFGTGPVKGFAVTLTIGLLASLFTAVFVTRIVFDYFVWNRKIQKLSI